MKKCINIKPNVSKKDFKLACSSTDYVKIASLEADLKRTRSKIKRAIIKYKLTKLRNKIEEFVYMVFDRMEWD